MKTTLAPIFLIVGAPATGKSTVSRALAARFPKSIAICVDDLRTMVVSGLVHPAADWSDELAEQLHLVRSCVVRMVMTYRAAGYAVMIDDFWDVHSQMREYGDLLDSGEMMRVLLYPEQQKAHAQNMKRSGQGAVHDYLDEGIRIVYDDLNKKVGDLTRQGWIVLDTTKDTVDDTANRLQALITQD